MRELSVALANIIARTPYQWVLRLCAEHLIHFFQVGIVLANIPAFLIGNEPKDALLFAGALGVFRQS